MEKIDKKECPKCKSTDIHIITKVDNGDTIIVSPQQNYPKFTNVLYHCKCNNCSEQFEFWPDKN